jgi:nucleotide-binding universal stress UspA family protein
LGKIQEQYSCNFQKKSFPKLTVVTTINTGNRHLECKKNSSGMKTIIIATDYSATANNALHFSASLASAVDAQLMIFNAYHLSVHASSALISPEAIDHLVQNNEDRLKKLAAETAEHFGIRVTWASTMEETVAALEDYAMKNGRALVVMGMDSNLTEYKLFGNTTTAVIGRLKFPVLVVPHDVSFRKIEKIIYACERPQDDQSLDLLREINQTFQAELQIIHVETRHTTDEDRTGIKDSVLKELNHTYRVIEDSNIGSGIIRGVNDLHADLLVMVPHKPGFLESLLKRSHTREMALKTRVPLLLLPGRD